MAKTVVSTNTLSNALDAYVLVSYNGETQTFKLYNLRNVSSGIDLTDDGFVHDSNPYDLALLIPRALDVEALCVSVNGSDDYFNYVKRPNTERRNGKAYSVYDIKKDSNFCPFMLIFGFARIQVVLNTSDYDHEIILTTRDIPCFSRESDQGLVVEQMLEELLDSDDDVLTDWMFAYGHNKERPYSTMEMALSDRRARSLLSMIQMLEDIIACYRINENYFSNHGFSKVQSIKSKLSLNRIRRAGHQELQWVAKNTDVLSETAQETSVNYLGRYYIPHYVETDRRIKSYDSYENRLVLGLLEEAIKHSRIVLKSVKNEMHAATKLDARLRAIQSGGYTLPAATLIIQYTKRGKSNIQKLEDIIAELVKLRLFYQKMLPGVKPMFTRSPRRTKVFQEVSEYSKVYDLTIRWLHYGEFTLVREQLAIHCMRLDKLYEYYVLYRLLKSLKTVGFEKDLQYLKPIEQVEYSVSDNRYENEKQVATLYRLARNEVHISLYYQPVIYGDSREENGITLHRLSRVGTYKRRLDSYWTPDYLLCVESGANCVEWHIFDAKYRKPDVLWDGFPLKGPFAETLTKYKSDIGGCNCSDEIETVWLICGRIGKNKFEVAEQSTWAQKHFQKKMSGVAILTPHEDCLPKLLEQVLKVDTSSQLMQFADDSASKMTSYEGIIAPEDQQTVFEVENLVFELDLIKKLYELSVDKEKLFDAKWAREELRFNQPLLRKRLNTAVKRPYVELELDGSVVYAFARMMEPQRNRLQGYIRRIQENADD